MKCEEFQLEIELTVPGEALPKAIQAHLDSCSHCQTFLQELSNLHHSLKNQEEARFSETELAAAADAVESKIARPAKSTFPLNQMLRAAAVVLIVATGYVGLQLGWHESSLAPITTTESDSEPIPIGSEAYADILGTLGWESVTAGEMGDDVANLLIRDFARSGSGDASERLLGDLSVEELKYLEENFSLGDYL